MAAQKGRDLLVKIHDGSASFEDANYNVVAGMRTNSFGFTAEQIDITNKDSGGFKESLDEAGNVGLEVSGGGVFLDDAAFQRVHDHFLARTHMDCKLVFPDFAEYTGKFSIDSLNIGGNETEAITYEIKMDSTGPITVTAL